ncbi:hypothetical protein HY604_00785 [Candidatus Peregrinibacteria bacterium]|nr:hypothetical protein [Candidatus Peregrinibacteria bacterium]
MEFENEHTPPTPEPTQGEKLQERQEEIVNQCKSDLEQFQLDMRYTAYPFPQTKWSDTWNPKKHPEYFRKVENGEFSEQERKDRTQILTSETNPNLKITIFRDNGLNFYRVANNTETKKDIRAKLEQFKEFAYIKNLPEHKLRSFNILDVSLTEGMLIPIPIPEDHRKFSEEEFLNHCHDGIVEMLQHEEYGCHVAELLEKIGEKELLTFMLTMAKVESGGLPLGQFEFHRYEKHIPAFSFSIFHVLMSGPGLTARKKLNLSEGQLYHPRNAAKLFLGFLVEKSGGNPGKFFPIMDHVEEFTSFYNGTAWRSINHQYPDTLTKFYKSSGKVLEKSYAAKETPRQKRRILLEFGETLPQAILRANKVNSAPKGEKMVKPEEVEGLAKAIYQYLQKKFKKVSFTTSDQIGVWRDQYGPYIIFRRKGHKEVQYRMAE